MIWLGPDEKIHFFKICVVKKEIKKLDVVYVCSNSDRRDLVKSEFSHQDLIRSFQSWAHFKGTYGGYNISLKDLLGNFVSLSSSSRPGCLHRLVTQTRFSLRSNLMYSTRNNFRAIFAYCVGSSFMSMSFPYSGKSLTVPRVSNNPTASF